MLRQLFVILTLRSMSDEKRKLLDLRCPFLFCLILGRFSFPMYGEKLLACVYASFQLFFFFTSLYLQGKTKQIIWFSLVGYLSRPSPISTHIHMIKDFDRPRLD